MGGIASVISLRQQIELKVLTQFQHSQVVRHHQILKEEEGKGWGRGMRHCLDPQAAP